MRIVITSNYKLGNETGTAHIAEELSEYLAKTNKVTYVCLGKKFEISSNNNLTLFKIPSIEMGSVSVPLITPNVIYELFTYLNNFSPDIIHAQNSLFICNLAQIWANLNQISFIVTFHHIPTQAFNHLFPKLSKNILSTLVQDLYEEFSLKKFLNNSDGVIALNKFVYNSIRKVDKNVVIKIINNGLNLNKFFSIKPRIKLKTRINFVFVGSYNERKNQEFLIKAFSFLPENYILNLYGNKSTGLDYVKKLLLQTNELKLKNVFINDYNDNIAEIYRGANFFISASLKEAQSLVIIEALASGKPVIGLENETITELINQGNGLVFSKNIIEKEFADKVTKFVNTTNYKELSINSRKSSYKFKIEKVALEIEKMYKSTSYSNSKNSRRNVGNYYQEIFKRIVIK
jgi:glycosyltransferase involved in cell wall biosynthesis